MRNRNYLSGAALVLFVVFANSCFVAGEPPEETTEHKATIYFSSAPWDGPAYDIEIPLEPTEDAPKPVIRVNLWGNPEYPRRHVVRFSGHEDSGGGTGKGIGRASYQTTVNTSMPEQLLGKIFFKVLLPGKPVIASYSLTSPHGKRFKGNFQAVWGNQATLGRR